MCDSFCLSPISSNAAKKKMFCRCCFKAILVFVTLSKWYLNLYDAATLVSKDRCNWSRVCFGVSLTVYEKNNNRDHRKTDSWPKLITGRSVFPSGVVQCILVVCFLPFEQKWKHQPVLVSNIFVSFCGGDGSAWCEDHLTSTEILQQLQQTQLQNLTSEAQVRSVSLVLLLFGSPQNKRLHQLLRALISPRRADVPLTDWPTFSLNANVIWMAVEVTIFTWQILTPDDPPCANEQQSRGGCAVSVLHGVIVNHGVCYLARSSV